MYKGESGNVFYFIIVMSDLETPQITCLNAFQNGFG